MGLGAMSQKMHYSTSPVHRCQSVILLPSRVHFALRKCKQYLIELKSKCICRAYFSPFFLFLFLALHYNRITFTLLPPTASTITFRPNAAYARRTPSIQFLRVCNVLQRAVHQCSRFVGLRDCVGGRVCRCRHVDKCCVVAYLNLIE